MPMTCLAPHFWRMSVVETMPISRLRDGNGAQVAAHARRLDAEYIADAHADGSLGHVDAASRHAHVVAEAL